LRISECPKIMVFGTSYGSKNCTGGPLYCIVNSIRLTWPSIWVIFLHTNCGKTWVAEDRAQVPTSHRCRRSAPKHLCHPFDDPLYPLVLFSHQSPDSPTIRQMLVFSYMFVHRFWQLQCLKLNFFPELWRNFIKSSIEHFFSCWNSWCNEKL